MAGQRSYYSNYLSTSRGPIETSQKFSVTTGSSPAASVLAGRQCSIAPAGAFASGTNNQFTVTLPEKFGKCVRLLANVVPIGTTGYAAVTSVDYNPATGTASFAICTGSAGALAGVTTNTTFTVYFAAAFELGF